VTRFLFDGHLLDTARRELRFGAETVPLEPLVFDLLLYLVANRDRVVGKDEILNAVWSGRIVSESAIATRIAAARRAIGDTGNAQTLIRTVARKGFRFVGQVVDEEGTVRADPGGGSLAEPTTLTLPDRPSIAVLPFANLSSDPEQEYFSDGMADDIITELSHDPSLFVISRNSSFTYKGRAVDVKKIAGGLGVRYILEGSVRRDRTQLRVNVQLIDAATGSHIWAERYDRALEAMFAVQDEITAAVVSAILPAVANAERHRALRKASDSLSAWEAWHLALWHWSAHDLARSRNCLELAVARDPGFAPPHALLAWLRISEATLGLGAPLHAVVAAAYDGAQCAIQLDHHCAIAHAMLAWVLDHQGFSGPALEEAEAAIALKPNDPQGHLIKGHILIYAGRRREGRKPLDLAFRLDPRGPVAAAVLLHLAKGCYWERDYSSSETFARRAIRGWPTFPRPYPCLAATLAQLGRSEEAKAALQVAMEISPGYLHHTTITRPAYHRCEDHEHLLDGLRKAGWCGRTAR
jgi:TolB-like protein